MQYEILEICGDYAQLRNLETGNVTEVAMFRLPEGVDVGDTLIFEDFEYRRG